MASLHERIPDNQSFADGIDYLVNLIVRTAPKDRARFENEVLEWAGQPETRQLASGIAGGVNLRSPSPQLRERLGPALHADIKQQGLTAEEYNSAIIALGELEYEPATELIATRFLDARLGTKNASTYALMLLAPERTGIPFQGYALEAPDEGARVAGVGLRVCYTRKGLDETRRRMSFIHPGVLGRITAWHHLPSQLKAELDDYTRRT